MIDATLEDLAYLINQAKQENLPKPIVFLGAGASKSGGVPLASEIIKDILIKYAEKPNIKILKNDEKTYPNLMACLTPFERNKLLKEYIDQAKINVTHIYLAQLIMNGYVDYVLTVNFDNLMLRALALFNEFPPTYDMAILKDLTTTSFKEKSVVYLHGQHHGLWLLNTSEEMRKVDEMIPPILSSIKNQRPWIFLGYSGEDPIFNHITKLGRFDNGLYWICYNDNNPCESVCENLIEKENTNAFVIKGYDSDLFMLQLNRELNLPQPPIIDTPFTSLSQILENIVDIDEKEDFKGIKERLEIVKNDVELAIKQFEKGEMVENEFLKDTIDKNILQKEIIDEIINKNYNQTTANLLESKSKILKDNSIKKTLAKYYFDWATEISREALSKNNEDLYLESLQKFEIAASLEPNNYNTYNNWAATLYDFGEFNKKEKYLKEGISKCKRAIEINDKNEAAYLNWSYILRAQARISNNEKLYLESCNKLKEASLRNELNGVIWRTWGDTLSDIGFLKKDKKYYFESFEKYSKSAEVDSNNYKLFFNWGITLGNLGRQEKDPKYFEEAFEKLKIALGINSKDYNLFNNWGSLLTELSKLTKRPELLNESLKLLNTAVNLGSSSYNLACLYAIQEDKVNALALLERSLKNKDISIEHVNQDSDWNSLKDNTEFKQIILNYS